MKPLMLLGVVLIVLGIGALAYEVIPIRHTEEVAKVGSLTIDQQKENDVVIPQYASIAAIVLGGVLVVFGRRA